jgi:hypothetical protein
VAIDSGSWCKSCKKEYLKQYKKKHKEHLDNLTKEWIKNNSEKHSNNKYKYYATMKGRIQDLLKGARKRAKQKNIAYDLSIEWITDLINKQDNKCALTKLDFFIPTEKNNHKALPFAPSIDRIDSSKGYTKDNVRVVCIAVNYALNEFGEDVFRQICEAYLSSSNK